MKPRNLDAGRATELTIAAQSGEPCEELIAIFYTLAKTQVKGFNLRSRSNMGHLDNADLVQEAVMICLQKIEKFDPSRGSALAFFSVVIRSTFGYVERYCNMRKRSPDTPTFSIESMQEWGRIVSAVEDGFVDDAARDSDVDQSAFPSGQPTGCRRIDYLTFNRSTRRVLSPEEIDDICDMARRGVSQANIARKHSLHSSTICRVVKRRKEQQQQ